LRGNFSFFSPAGVKDALSFRADLIQSAIFRFFAEKK